jgi:hypothetical protein
VSVLALLVQLVPAGVATAGGAEPEAAEAPVAHTPPESGDAPGLTRTRSAERTARRLGDAVFVRPFLFVQLVAGIAVLPAALPIAAVFADWRDALDICVEGPYEMVFERALGE